MTIRAAAIAVLCMLATACAAVPDKPWVKSYRSEADCNQAIREQLRDPGSYEMTEMRIRQDDTDPEAGQAIIQFRAKNGFGGYGSGIAICERVKDGDTYKVTARISNE
jgi:hypothetical protein